MMKVGRLPPLVSIINLHADVQKTDDDNGGFRHTTLYNFQQFKWFNLQYLGDHFPFLPFPFHMHIVVVTLDFLPPCFLVHWQKIIIHEIFHMFIAFRGIKDILRFISQTESAAVDWPIDYMVPVNNGKMADLIALLPEQWSMSYERRRRTDR